MTSFRRTLAKLAYFLGRGPAYHLAYARWKGSGLWQRVRPRDYRPGAGNAVGDAQLRFFFDPGDVDGIVSSIGRVARERTLREADEICAGRFRFRQAQPVDMPGKVDWQFAPQDDPDWRWDLNRHAYFETLGRAWRYSGDERYARCFAKLLAGWLDDNPPVAGRDNWASAFEVGFRINSWSWAWHLFAGCAAIDEATRQRLLGGIGMHCEYLYANLELNARNNHLLLEAKALFFGAVLYPGFANAGRWRRRAEQHLLREVRHQVHEDGVHGEMSTHYHRVIAGELLELLLLLRLNGMDLPADVCRRIENMAEFDLAITRPDGTLPLFGDSSEQDTYARFSAANAGPYVFGFAIPPYAATEIEEASAWHLARTPTREPPRATVRSRAFPDGGFYVLRSGETAGDALQLAVDAGPFGLPMDPHHGHADALSFDLYARGRAWLVDSGVYSTHASWPWRHYFRGTASHNTVCVDGEDQSVLLDSRRAVRLARTECVQWSVGTVRDILDARHDGYRRLPDPVQHRRIVWFLRDRYWVLADLLDGKGTHRLSANFHCPPAIEVDAVRPGLLRLHAPGDVLWLSFASTAPFTAAVREGEERPIQGWRSANSGEKTPAPTIALEHAGALPCTLYTLMLPARAGELRHPQLAADARGVTVTVDGQPERFDLPSQAVTG